MLKLRKNHLRSAIRIGAVSAVIIGLGGMIALQVKDSKPANALNMRFNVVGTHPRAAALLGTAYEYGADIRDLGISGGKLYAAYGDWQNNSDSWGPAEGRTAIVPFDLATKTFESQNEVMVGSEAIQNFRTINGALYVTTTDPSIHGSGGYFTNQSGSWVYNNAAPQAVHVFDIATLDGSDLWLFGARDDYPPFDGSVGKAIAWRSTDGGATWNEARVDESEPGQGYGFERYYWGQKAGDKIFMHAAGTVPDSPMRSYDGTTWRDHGANRCAASQNKVISFNGKIICAEGYIDGGASYNVSIDSDGTMQMIEGLGYTFTNDFYVDGSYLYVLGSDGTIRRSTDLNEWQDLGKYTPNGTAASSIAVYNGKIYLGDTSGRILESEMTIDDTLAVAGPETCFLTNGNGTLLEYFDNENDNPANPACSKTVVIPNEIDNETITTIGEGAFSYKAITSLTIPASVTSIKSEAFNGNELTSVDLPDGLTELGSYAFSRNHLGSIDIPDGISVIAAGVFTANDLTSIDLPAGTTQINDYAFESNSIDRLTLPSGVTSIGWTAFANNGISQLSLNDGLQEISYGAFSDNLIESVRLPNSVTSVGYDAFSRNKISELVLSNGMTVIEPAFKDNMIKTVTIPDSVTTIDQQAFVGQGSLSEPNQVEMDALNGQPARPAASNLDEYLGSIWYVRLYTQTPSNPNNIQDSAYVEKLDETTCPIIDWRTQGDVTAQADDPSCREDYNQDGDKDDIIMANYGGHLVNPAFVNIESKTRSGQDLAPTKQLSGKQDGTYFTSYMVKDGPKLEAPESDGNVGSTSADFTTLATDADNTVILQGSYFRIGQTIQVPASILSGYKLVAGSSSLVSITLTAAINTVTFVYELSNPLLIPGAPSTGLSGLLMVNVFSALVLGLSVLIWHIVRRRTNA